MGRLNGEIYQVQKDKLFRHRVYLKKYSTGGKILTEQICWKPAMDTWEDAEKVSRCPEYHMIRSGFFQVCKEKSIPYHNAFSFWERFLGDCTKLTNEEVYSLILGAVCGYGDCFIYATTRAVPENFVWSEDLELLQEKPTDDFCQNVANQIYQVMMSIPELTLSLDHFEQFKNAWNFHFCAAESFQKWKMRYDQLKFRQYTDIVHENHDIQRPLVRIFRQYICLLNEYSNSAKYGDFEKCYEDFERGEGNALFYSFDQIIFLLNTHEELAQIAPIYVLNIFQKLTTKLYTGLSTSSVTQVKVKLAAFSNAQPQLYSGTKSNTKVPRNIQIITYQILCEYFQCSEVVKAAYKPDLCNYILQSCIPLIGQSFFKVDKFHADAIIKTGKCYHYTDFEQTDEWVHFLLGEIDKRLRYSLALYPDSVPKISFTDMMPPHPHLLITKAEKLVDLNFVKEYFETSIQPADGLGCPRISEKVQVKLSELMDRTLSRAGLTPKLSMDYVRELLAYETGFHNACADMLYDEYYLKVMCFLYNYFQSDAFPLGKPIPTVKEWKEIQKDGSDILEPVLTVAQPIWPIPQISPQQLNIVNRDDS